MRNFLKQKTKPVHLPLSENNQNILDDLLDTFKAVPCAGVAANQIGYDKRIFIGLKHDDYDDGQDEEENKNISDKTGNPNADNYDSNASIDDGSCIIIGCMINSWFILGITILLF